MAKLTLDDLKKIKEKASHTMALRSGEALVTVTVHMGDCGIGAGARDVMQALLKEKAESQRADIKILAGECLGSCSSEPNMSVQFKGDKKSTVYQKIDSVKTKQIFQKHIIGGEVQKEFLFEAA
ncbi:MAG: (2Fe-2S) ferredoxin domain-containing protein [Desulfamplus sp.]|nr:(2Fe-2S) ferredoxin domain-containing protein [Desulfamplus sp.]